jgi:hypothetical protein
MAQPDDVPVQHMEFDEYVVQPSMEVIEFGDYVIQPSVEVYEFDEMVIVSQKDDVDDGDGENLDMMNSNWCLIHPDDVKCLGDEDQGGDDEEEGC